LNFNNLFPQYTGEVDWGNFDADLEAPVGEIDFSVDPVEFHASGIVVEEHGLEGGVARDEEALSILENIDTRNQFMDDLYEVGKYKSKPTIKSNTVLLFLNMVFLLSATRFFESENR